MNHKRIYIAEDDPAHVKLIQLTLESIHDYHLTFFPDGLALYQEVQKDPPDLLILDIILPSLSGLAIARLLKFHDNFKEIPIVIISSITDHDIQARSLQSGANVFIPKPLNLEQFPALLSRLLA